MNILIIRFSSLGDVILIRPVVISLLKKYPNTNISILSNTNFKSLFEFDHRIHFIGIDLNKEKKNISQIINHVFKEHQAEKFNAIYDLHNVIRSKAIRLALKTKGVKARVFEKGRKEKKLLIQGEIPFEQLTHTTIRYLDCLRKDFPLISSDFSNQTMKKSNEKLEKTIGIAPFAKHESKIWPIENFKEVEDAMEGYNFLIFAFGKKEREQASKIFKNYTLVDESLNFEQQLNLINQLPAFISMDSANMHLASLTNTKVISIWGPTHHYIGFGPLNNEKYIINNPENEVISVFGKIKTKDLQKAKESMNSIKPESVINMLKLTLKD